MGEEMEETAGHSFGGIINGDLAHDATALNSNENGSCITIPIVGFETMDERAKFTIFKLKIENDKLTEPWLVFRRYTDFTRLHTKLKEEFPDINLPLPPKRWIRNNFETGFLEDRMKGLQALVDSIVVHPTLLSSATVRKFFCLDEPPSHTDSAEESRSLFGSSDDGLSSLRQKVSDKDLELEILKAELALVTSQRDHLMKLVKNCRFCSQRPSFSGCNSNSSASSLTGSPVASSSRVCSPRRSDPGGRGKNGTVLKEKDTTKLQSPPYIHSKNPNQCLAEGSPPSVSSSSYTKLLYKIPGESINVSKLSTSPSCVTDASEIRESEVKLQP